MLVNETKSEHWYRVGEDGKVYPCYELPKKTGDGTKAVTLREAKELGLLPSVTGICRVLDKPFLNNWRVEQGILAALTLPRAPGEPLEAFARRVVEDMGEEVNTAAQAGTDLHDELMQKLIRHDEEDLRHPGIGSALTWLRNHMISVTGQEKCVGNKIIGVAGRLDISGTWDNYHGFPAEERPCVIDIKTQKVKKEAVFYPEWGLQLAAYGYCEFGDKPHDLISLVIPREPGSPVQIRVWDNRDELLDMFKHCVELWCWLKGYDPRDAI